MGMHTVRTEPTAGEIAGFVTALGAVERAMYAVVDESGAPVTPIAPVPGKLGIRADLKRAYPGFDGAPVEETSPAARAERARFHLELRQRRVNLQDSRWVRADGLAAPFSTFKRATQAQFDDAFSSGKRVGMVKDASYADVFNIVSRGFTCATVDDPYVDGPSRPGESWHFFVEIDGTRTPTGPAVWGADAFGFYCECGGGESGFATIAGATSARDLHATAHERPAGALFELEEVSA